MSNDTSVTIIGNATRDPELRWTSGGMPVAEFGVAVNHRQRNAQGEWEDGDTSFFDVTCFRQLAENIAETISKGDSVVVVGSLRQDRWTDDQGNNRSKVKVIADLVGPSLRWATATVDRNAGQTRQPTNEQEEPF
mgnify:CR=1 FL=1